MQFVLVPAPIDDIHGRDEQRLRPHPDEPVGNARVAEIITDADADLAPGRFPKLLLRCRQTVLEELDRHALALAKNNFSGRPDDKSGVIKVCVRRWILSPYE